MSVNQARKRCIEVIKQEVSHSTRKANAWPPSLPYALKLVSNLLPTPPLDSSPEPFVSLFCDLFVITVTDSPTFEGTQSFEDTKTLASVLLQRLQSSWRPAERYEAMQGLRARLRLLISDLSVNVE